MIDLLYHATIYYDVHKYIQELKQNAIKYEVLLEMQSLMRETALSTRTTKLPMGCQQCS